MISTRAAGPLVLCLTFARLCFGQASIPGEDWPLVTPSDDAALVRLATDTLRTHPQVAAAKAALETNEALVRAAEQPLFNPALELAVEPSANDELTLALSQTLDWSGQRAARTAVAGGEREVALAGLAATRQAIARELLDTLADYWLASELSGLADSRVELMERFAETARRRERAGDLNPIDLSAARLGLAQARIERANLASALLAAEQILRALTSAQPAGSWARLPTELPTVTLGQSDIARALEALPVMRAQRAAVAAAHARVDLRESERRPSPTVAFQAGQEEGDSLVGLSFSMPLNVRNPFRQEVAAARADWRRTESDLNNARTRALARLLAATERYRLIRDAWTEWQAAGAPSLTEQTGLLERVWEAGDLGLTDYLVQLNQTFDTGAGAINLKGQLWDAWFEWLNASGQLGAWLYTAVE